MKNISTLSTCVTPKVGKIHVAPLMPCYKVNWKCQKLWSYVSNMPERCDLQWMDQAKSSWEKKGNWNGVECKRSRMQDCESRLGEIWFGYTPPENYRKTTEKRFSFLGDTSSFMVVFSTVMLVFVGVSRWWFQRFLELWILLFFGRIHFDTTYLEDHPMTDVSG